MDTSKEIIKSYIDTKLMNIADYHSVLYSLIYDNFKNYFWKDNIGSREIISFYDIMLENDDGIIDIYYDDHKIVVSDEVKLEIYYYLLELFNFFKDNNLHYNEKQTNRS